MNGLSERDYSANPGLSHGAIQKDAKPKALWFTPMYRSTRRRLFPL